MPVRYHHRASELRLAAFSPPPMEPEFSTELITLSSLLPRMAGLDT